jgi:ferric-dicitrate binding protein FerR (iron transport regulator)
MICYAFSPSEVCTLQEHMAPTTAPRRRWRRRWPTILGILAIILVVLCLAGVFIARSILVGRDSAARARADLAAADGSAVGLVAGSYPAFWASRLTRINALRSE